VWIDDVRLILRVQQVWDDRFAKYGRRKSPSSPFATQGSRFFQVLPDERGMSRPRIRFKAHFVVGQSSSHLEARWPQPPGINCLRENPDEQIPPQKGLVHLLGNGCRSPMAEGNRTRRCFRYNRPRSAQAWRRIGLRDKMTKQTAHEKRIWVEGLESRGSRPKVWEQ